MIQPLRHLLKPLRPLGQHIRRQACTDCSGCSKAAAPNLKASTLNWKDVPRSGLYKYVKGGNTTPLWPPNVYLPLHKAVKSHAQGDIQKAAQHYQKYTQTANASIVSFSDLLELKAQKEPIPLDDVAPVEDWLACLNISHMSFGALSKPATESIASAVNELRSETGHREGTFCSGSGEGGEDSAALHKHADAQVAPALFGVSLSYLAHPHKKRQTVKAGQKAKPGQGGELPPDKVGQDIAKARHSVPGVGLSSPAHFETITSIEDLKSFATMLKKANPWARLDLKIVAKPGSGNIAAGAMKAPFDGLLLSGSPGGGTAAAPLPHMTETGQDKLIALREVMHTLGDQKIHIKSLQVDGGIQTGKDVMTALACGASEVGFGMMAMALMNCNFQLDCHNNSCKVGITSHKPELLERFTSLGKDQIKAGLLLLAENMRHEAAALGIRHPNELSLCHVQTKSQASLPKSLPFASRVNWGSFFLNGQENPVNPSLPLKRIPDDIDTTLVTDPSIQSYLIHASQNNPGTASVSFQLKNADMAATTRLSSLLFTLENRHLRTSDDLQNVLTTHYRLPKTLSQSLAGLDPFSFDPLSLRLHFSGVGPINAFALAHPALDIRYQGQCGAQGIGTALDGGRIVLQPPEASRYHPLENHIAEGALGYGATRGDIFAQGRTGPRAGVRLSGANLVVEGIAGDGAFQFMSGGLALFLGGVRNAPGRGQTGGIAVVRADSRASLMSKLDPDNPQQVCLPCTPEFDDLILPTLFSYQEETQSLNAKQIAKSWDSRRDEFFIVSTIPYLNTLDLPLNGSM